MSATVATPGTVPIRSFRIMSTRGAWLRTARPVSPGRWATLLLLRCHHSAAADQRWTLDDLAGGALP
jgi:hypothetical protein